MTLFNFASLLLEMVSGGGRSGQVSDDDNNRPLIYRDDIFVPQEHAYDCGLACLKMSINSLALACKRDEMLSALDACELRQIASPLWTVDLYCFLREHDVSAVMYTTCAGVNSSHSKISWYHQTHCSGDIERVVCKFETAKLRQWRVEVQAISIERIVEHFSRGSSTSAIILINNYSTPLGAVELRDSSTNHTSSSSAAAASLSSADQYAGHYIYLTSFDEQSNVFSFLDPARGNSAEKYISPYALEVARSHRGTDHDAILLFGERIG